MTQILSNISSLDPLLLGQAGPVDGFFQSQLGVDLGVSVLGVIKAILIFVIGWIIATIIKSIIKKVLNSTDIDNKIAAALTGQRGGESIPVESWIANLVFWLIMLFVIIAALNALELQAVSAPLNTLLDEIAGFIPRLLGAAFLLAIAWLVATIVKTIVTRGLGALNIEQRLGLTSADTGDFSITDTLGNALYWFIFLLFLPAILNALELNGTLQPIQGMLDEILALLPNILGAIIIAAVFWFVANIVKRIVSNLLSATGVDNIGRKFGLGRTAGSQSLSSIIGTIVFVLILIPGIISALEQLQIAAISDPATDMLNQVLDFVPKLFAAGVVLALFYVAGKFVSEFVSNILANIGFNNLGQWLGLSSTTTGTDVPPPGAQPLDQPIELGVGSEQPTKIQTEPTVSSKSPSELVGLICWIAIMLVAALTAVDILRIPALTDVFRVILAIAGQVLIGVLVFAIGLYLANLAFNLILSSGTTQSRLLAQSARIAIITLVGAMALNRMGIAPNIVNLAFGLILGGIAVAIALAFGLGGREVAREELRSWVGSFKGK
ncbi:mechanosensitive ion channel [Pleurocapsales cyanobacterium LEGE 10410]|nr:mechanosensitive ion channel [Pleurocapsales cyanobacterium LEGE 10410]